MRLQLIWFQEKTLITQEGYDHLRIVGELDWVPGS